MPDALRAFVLITFLAVGRGGIGSRFQALPEELFIPDPTRRTSAPDANESLLRGEGCFYELSKNLPRPGPRGIHADRTARRDRHHRRPDRLTLAGGAEGAGGRQPHHLRQQPPPDRPGPPQLPRGPG